MNRLTLILAVALVAGVTSCNTTKNANNEHNDSAKMNTEGSKAQEATKDVPYTLAEHYFVKNTVKEFNKDPKITTSEKFNEVFGMATTMGPSGKPTDIDFAKQYVIAIVQPETDYSTRITPVSLQKSGDEIVFTYKIEKGEKQTYTIRPTLAIIVDKAHDGKLVVKEQQ